MDNISNELQTLPIDHVDWLKHFVCNEFIEIEPIEKNNTKSPIDWDKIPKCPDVAGRDL